MKLDRTDWVIILTAVVAGVIAAIIVSVFLILAFYPDVR